MSTMLAGVREARQVICRLTTPNQSGKTRTNVEGPLSAYRWASTPSSRFEQAVSSEFPAWKHEPKQAIRKRRRKPRRERRHKRKPDRSSRSIIQIDRLSTRGPFLHENFLHANLRTAPCARLALGRSQLAFLATLASAAPLGGFALTPRFRLR